MIYQTLEQLGNNTLQLGDFIYFYPNGRQLKYSVQSDHLSNCFKCDNAEIFSILGIINRKDFCNSHYRYYNYGGDWPSSKPNDFAALTRVVKALYQEIEHKKARENIEYSYSKHLIQGLKTNLNTLLSNPLLTSPSGLEKEENTSSSNIITKRKSKIKKIIGEETIELNNY